MYGNVLSVLKYKIMVEDLKTAIHEKQKGEDFKKEYAILQKGLLYPHVEGSKDDNKVKNRFLSLWPYDHSRVVLEGDTAYDYINASYIDNYEKEKAYIAAQGPNNETVRDFWHMIWQEKVGKVVMVTQLKENQKTKCAQYWPKSVTKPLAVNNYIVTLKEERKHTVYVYRLLTVLNKNDTNEKERKIHHFHFTQWPDHGVPDSIKLVSFYRKVKIEKCYQNGLMVVHCSAGVGRTGTFIAIDALYENGKNVGYVNVMECIEMMRKDRMNMVQTYEQYEAVFEALLELFTVPETSIPKTDFCKYISDQEHKTVPRNQNMYKVEFQRLETLRPMYLQSAHTAATSKENIPKNSAKKIFPHDKYRPYLMSYGKTRNDYINAVTVPGYEENSKLFVTQCPLEKTVVDFWTMVYDHQSNIVVLLDQLNMNAPLWLKQHEVLEFDQFSIVQENVYNPDELQFTLRHENQGERKITVFTPNESNGTSDNVFPSNIILDLLKNVNDCWEENKGPITVVCSDGCSKSGVFVALRLILEKLAIDDEIDVFQVVRTIQVRRPEFLMNFDQYEYCYKCIKDHLENESLYANV
ncbi:receptor-type tyrosine-protein phosphatase epsilon-like [Mytilus galloprovincialis]|uniref:receptor-type tyrosine-protein phosphatase epsilon-like n=1 Tax=Mytilus galloprovincialis TaxID=29158 RepID=UPI003F7BDED0